MSFDAVVYQELQRYLPIEACMLPLSKKWRRAYQVSTQYKFLQLYRHEPINSKLRKAAKLRDKRLIQFLIGKGADDLNWGMYGAARGGHMDLVLFFIDKGADEWNWGMCQAVRGDHKNLVLFFIDKGADNWNCGMGEAVRGGHEDLVQLFKQRRR